MDAQSVTEEQLLAMKPEDYDRLTFGIIELDLAGDVVGFNAVEQRLARMSEAETLGRNFWTDVAPCTDNDKFRALVDGLLDRDDKDEVRFEYVFQFAWGERRVRIRALRVRERRWLFVTPLGRTRDDT